MGISKLLSFASATEEDPLCEQEEALPPPLPTCKSNDSFYRAANRQRRAVIAACSAGGSLLLVVGAMVAGVHLPMQGGEAPPPVRAAPHARSLPHHGREVVQNSLCDYNEIPVCPAWDLFSSPEVHNVATMNLMRAGRDLLTESERPEVAAAVATGFVNISRQLQRKAPVVAGELNMLQLTEMQKNAVLDSLRLLSEPRVQELGREHSVTGRGRCAMEGLNCTLTGSAQGLRSFCQGLRDWNKLFMECDFKFTDGLDAKKKFKALTIRKVDELVAYGLEGSYAPSLKRNAATNLNADEYHKMMADPDAVIIDVRNVYESAIGHFQPPDSGAELIIPPVRHSFEFPKRSSEDCSTSGARTLPRFAHCYQQTRRPSLSTTR